MDNFKKKIKSIFNYYGIENIQDKWKQRLKKYDYIIELCDKFDEALI